MNNLIIQKYPDNIYSLYLPSTIKITKSSTSPVEVQTCNLLPGKSYQVNNKLKIALLIPNLVFFTTAKKDTTRVEYRLEPHPKLVNFYIVREVKEEFLETLIKDDFCHTVSKGEIKDWL